MSQNTSHAVMAQRFEPHDSLDYFPTPPWATRALCEFLMQMDDKLSTKRAWEPACGEGHMVRPLSEYFELVYGSDIGAYGHGNVRDFLFPGDEPEFDWIITNPPFRLGEQFAHTMIDRAREGAAILVRTSFLEGIGRYTDLFSKRKPHAILQFTERVPMLKGRLDAEGSTATSYCWIVWRCRPHKPSFNSMPMFVWIPPCRRQLERPGDYANTPADRNTGEA
jgi:hypothetical protein